MSTETLHHRSRALRNVTEPIAAGVYFAPEAHQGYEAQGLDYFEGYFCSRSACLGAAPWSVVCAAFAAFKPAAVESSVTNGWAKTTPPPMLAAREAGATAQLERLVGDAVEPDHRRAGDRDPLRRQRRRRPVRAGAVRGALDPRATDHPFGALWRAADLVREHRGDGHIAAWMPHVDSTEITVMTELAWGIPPRSYVFTRGLERGRGRRRVRTADRSGSGRRRSAHRRRHRAARPHRAHDRRVHERGDRPHRGRLRRADRASVAGGRGRRHGRWLPDQPEEPPRVGLTSPAPTIAA